MRKVVNFGCCYHAVEISGTTFALEELVKMFSDPMKYYSSYRHHFNWFYCLKNLQIFFRKVALTAILFFHVVVMLSLISIFKIDCYTEYEYFPQLLNMYKVILYKICLLSSEVSI